MKRLVLPLLLLLCGAGAVRAETLVISMSSHRVQIASNFVGGELTLFGVVERDASSITRAGQLDLVVIAKGPLMTQTVRQKAPVLGLWINQDAREFHDVPVSYMVQSTRPLNEIADAHILQRFQIGKDALVLASSARIDTASPKVDDPFERAFLRLQTARGLYRENVRGVTFVTPSLFRTTIPVPATTATGDFDVDVFLFAGGALLAREKTNFEVTKAGFEAQVVRAAYDHSLLYGVFAALLALFTGWAASIVFKRD